MWLHVPFSSGNSDISKELNQYNATFITTRRSTENRSEEKTKTRAINAATHFMKSVQIWTRNKSVFGNFSRSD